MAGRSRVHFIGIGGAGMSGIALVLHERGVNVSGSDLKRSRYVRQLEKAGIPVVVGHDAATIERFEPDIVVVSSAIPEENPELRRARELGIEVWARAQMLSALSEGSTTIAVAGTHGKTTTSSMVAAMLDDMGLDPSFLIGGVVEGYDTNGRDGQGGYFVAEADESDGSFLYLDPDIVVVTNVEADHLDHYGSLDAIREAFGEFMGLAGPEGRIVCCGEDASLVELARGTGVPVWTYGHGEGMDVTLRETDEPGVCEVTVPDGTTVTVTIASNPGVHNLLNATAAIAVAAALDLDVEAAARSLSRFRGVRRRFTRMGEAAGVTVVDDYGHHPTEIRATLRAAKSLDYDRVVVVFQPHRYSRTEALAKDFGAAFDDADELVVMDVFAAGEMPIPGVSGRLVAQAVRAHDPDKQVTYAPTRLTLVDTLESIVRPGDLLITMGAGDVTMVGPELLERLGAEEG